MNKPRRGIDLGHVISKLRIGQGLESYFHKFDLQDDLIRNIDNENHRERRATIFDKIMVAERWKMRRNPSYKGFFVGQEDDEIKRLEMLF